MTGYFNVLDDWRKRYPKVCYTNNDRKMHGLPMRRKTDKRKKLTQGTKRTKILKVFTIRFGNKVH